MPDDRRYKQRGYQDADSRPASQPQGFSPGVKRLPVITQYKETVRCSECGHDLTTLFEIQRESRCPRCGADLHTCRNCRHFDTGSRLECAQPIPKRMPTKDRANTCTLFTPRTIVVKELGQAAAMPGSGAPAPAAPAPNPAAERSDARAALEKLFKK